MGLAATTIPATIEPLVRRHAEDAAFYWQYIDTSRTSVHLSWQKFKHFDRMLGAHLEGLQVAGSAGLSTTLAALDRWKKAGEAFAGSWVAMQSGDAAGLARVMSLVRARPDTLLRGVVSALARLPLSRAQDILHRWSGEPSDPVTAVAALRAAALIGAPALPALSLPLAHWLVHPAPFVRAAACRAAAATRSASPWQHEPMASQARDTAAALVQALGDSDHAVRAEASIALGGSAAHRSQALAVLWRCVMVQAAHAQQATGWFRQQANRRLDRWLRHLACLVPMRHPDIPGLYAFLPARAGLYFALHHGDPSHLPYVTSRIAHPEEARYAAWVWQTLTGIDLAAHGLTLEEHEPAGADDRQLLTAARLDADNGLPMPNLPAVQHAQLTLRLDLGTNQRLLYGRQATQAWLVELLQHAPQPLRAVAAHALHYRVPGVGLSVRGGAESQCRQIEQLPSAGSTEPWHS
ncbi:hypothetical protein VAPA_1c02590 [Variovorax paradoxus B4]|uniref:Uncharacterized protein n=1 Tax=Variovorax paradoxus B4 TaxID=1246301 RepID=T1X4W9_VARPD|nr:hypothetical protein [Variovorax paradoxus]AGU47389.1 hypothetical protein VAPA_1c02590 [Variovorax paradoxus B4]